VLGADAAFIVAEDHIHNPVEAVFDCSVAANDGAKLVCQPYQRRDVKPGFAFDFVAVRKYCRRTKMV
jgi:hypothetical protein